MKKLFFKKTLATLFALAFLIVPAFAAVLAPVPARAEVDLWGGMQDTIQTELGYTEAKDPRLIAASLIQIILSFLGLLAVVLIIWAGFKWMTAQGNEENVKDAQKILKAAVIGLIIILAAWGIANFAISQLTSAVNQ
jgi:hypothetical protein